MSKFRKKPVVIEATQWFKMGDHPAVVLKSDPRRYSDDGVPWVNTLEGGHVVTPGDWIITGIKGEFYPCKPDIFAATYEPADSAAPGGDVEKRARELMPAPCGFVRATDGRYEIRIGGERPANRSGGYSTPWNAIFDTPAVERAIIAALSASKTGGGAHVGDDTKAALLKQIDRIEGDAQFYEWTQGTILVKVREAINRAALSAPNHVAKPWRPVEGCEDCAYNASLCDKHGAAPQPVEAEGREDVWGRFASWLLDHCEGMIISEEMLQQQLDVMLATSSKQDPAEAEELRSCAICGLTVDLSNGHTKPTIDFGMAGRSKPKAPQPEQPAIDHKKIIELLRSHRLTRWQDDAGNQLPLVDHLTPPGSDSIQPGLDEIEQLADELMCAIIDGAKAGRAEGEES